MHFAVFASKLLRKPAKNGALQSNGSHTGKAVVEIFLSGEESFAEVVKVLDMKGGNGRSADSLVCRHGEES